jgi:predicted GIY-YIG superfamily endonuclease
MPKTPMDYSKCSIYEIEHIENESLVYVGHTTNFSKRKGEHKCRCKNENGKAFDLKLYQMIRDNGDFEMFKMIEVEKYPCKDKREALRREDESYEGTESEYECYKKFLNRRRKERKRETIS